MNPTATNVQTISDYVAAVTAELAEINEVTVDTDLLPLDEIEDHAVVLDLAAKLDDEDRWELETYVKNQIQYRIGGRIVEIIARTAGVAI